MPGAVITLEQLKKNEVSRQEVISQLTRARGSGLFPAELSHLHINRNIIKFRLGPGRCYVPTPWVRIVPSLGSKLLPTAYDVHVYEYGFKKRGKTI